MQDWRAVADGAEWHGLLPVLARWLANGRASFVPRDIDAEVRQTAHAEAMRGIALANELVAMVSRLEGAGVPVIALMGPALAMRASDVVSHRPPGNLDLLVKAADVERALSVFDALGYRLADTVIPGQDAALREPEYHHGLTNGAGIVVELHWRLTKRQYGHEAEDAFWWANHERTSVAGSEVSALRDDALLIYLAIHGGKHEWWYLRWIGDIAAVAQKEKINWRRVKAMAKGLGALRMVRLALALATDVLGAELPEAARTMAHEDQPVAALVDVVRQRLEGENAPFVADSTRFQLALRERLRDRATFTFRSAMETKVSSFEVRDFPVAWRGVYYVLQPVRLLRQRMGWKG